MYYKNTLNLKQHTLTQKLHKQTKKCTQEHNNGNICKKVNKIDIKLQKNNTNAFFGFWFFKSYDIRYYWNWDVFSEMIFLFKWVIFVKK
jgi:hypothetical protein